MLKQRHVGMGGSKMVKSKKLAFRLYVLILNLNKKRILTQQICCVECIITMIPPCTQQGLLPPGIHWAEELNEITKHFATTPRRLHLLNGFLEGAAMLKAVGCRFVYLDGSFVTTKENPNDFDACWETLGVDLDRLDPVFKDFSDSRSLQKARFGGEFFPSLSTADSAFRTFLDFFQEDKDTGAAKGIVAVKLSLLR